MRRELDDLALESDDLDSACISDWAGRANPGEGLAYRSWLPRLAAAAPLKLPRSIKLAKQRSSSSGLPRRHCRTTITRFTFRLSLRHALPEPEREERLAYALPDSHSQGYVAATWEGSRFPREFNGRIQCLIHYDISPTGSTSICPAAPFVPAARLLFKATLSCRRL